MRGGTVGPLVLADGWSMMASPHPDGDTATFSGLLPCIAGMRNAKVLAVRPAAVLGSAEITDSHVRTYSASQGPAGAAAEQGYMIMAYGRPPRPMMDDLVFGGDYVPLGHDDAIIDLPCRSEHGGTAPDLMIARDITVTIKVHDVAMGGGIDGLHIDYTTGSKKRTATANVKWVLCGRADSDICATSGAESALAN